MDEPDRYAPLVVRSFRAPTRDAPTRRLTWRRTGKALVRIVAGAPFIVVMWSSDFGWGLALIVAFLVGLLPFAIALTAALTRLLPWLWRGSATVRVGLDGVEVSVHRPRQRLFLRHDAIDAADATDDPVSCVRLLSHDGPLFLPLRSSARDRVVDRLALEQRRLAERPASLGLLVRRNRPVSEWLRDVASLTTQQESGAYREGPKRDDAQALELVLTDARISPLARVDMAEAIAASGSEALIELARRIADGCVEPGVREQLIGALETGRRSTERGEAGADS